MIAENAANLVGLIRSVPSLANSAGFAAGGKAPDPALTKIPLPAAWVLYIGDKPNEPSTGANPAGQTLTANFVVMLYIPYVSETDLETNQYPLLEAVIQSIRGQQAPKGMKWHYEGQRLASVNPDRLSYEQRYSLTAFV